MDWEMLMWKGELERVPPRGYVPRLGTLSSVLGETSQSQHTWLFKLSMSVCNHVMVVGSIQCTEDWREKTILTVQILVMGSDSTLPFRGFAMVRQQG